MLQWKGCWNFWSINHRNFSRKWATIGFSSRTQLYELTRRKPKEGNIIVLSFWSRSKEMWTFPKANRLPGRKSHPIHPKRKAKIIATTYKCFIVLKTWNSTLLIFLKRKESVLRFLSESQVISQLITDYVPFLKLLSQNHSCSTTEIFSSNNSVKCLLINKIVYLQL
jgi:hypothetical protein